MIQDLAAWFPTCVLAAALVVCATAAQMAVCSTALWVAVESARDGGDCVVRTRVRVDVGDKFIVGDRACSWVAEEYDTVSGSWRAIVKSLPNVYRYGSGCAALGSFVYMVAGSGGMFE
eukprot:TRINITY_DN10813_c0_g1_i2.p5 TRINITY_DN10813_c0_g1~~TRINITY_DN10813_c0_g1_i2.p5  ORF type:complete len:118 (+),score=13.42 TRINITY_DN10813_c0_g1_i2:126-479(+)